MSDYLVVGLDVGGTSTRAVVADLDGVRHGLGRAGGGNPTALGGTEAAGAIRVALDEALAGVDPARVRAGAIGLAGYGRLASDPAARRALDEAWHGAGLRPAYEVVGDALLGYASATGEPDGTVLVAGTGAIGAAVRGLTLDRVVDGHGWLLGDLGSGCWLGREAVRAALAVLDGAAADGPLARTVRRRLLGTEAIEDPPRPTARALVAAVHARPPVALAELAPVVLEAYDGDPAARAVVERGAAHLARTLELVHAPGLPMVLAGGLLATDTPIARVLRTHLGSVPLTAGDTAAAAAWLAARTLPGVDPGALHGRLVRAGGQP